MGTDATQTDPGRSRPAAAGLAAAGAMFAHFRIERRIGTGGMGDVYLARDVALDRPVALKLLAADIAGEPDLRQRFLREARYQARISHPNVAHIYYIGEQDGQLFFAMEYIEGENLQERLARGGPLAPAEALAVCRQAALGLAEAHRHGFTHRDVKPSNLMVDRHGVVKLVDFGIVKQTGEAEGAGGRAALTARLTQDGTQLLGTPVYMAPEQARGDRIDHRTDIYSLGATLHHLVAGTPPFQGPTPQALIAQLTTAPRPRLAARRRRGPTALDLLLDRMMAKRPEDRFAGYEELLVAMDRASPAVTRPAGLWVRAFALGLDAAVAALLTAVVELPLPEVGDWLFWLIAAVYVVATHARWGRTAGKALLEIEVVRADRDGPPGLRAAAVRFLAELGPLYLGVGALDLVALAGVTGTPRILMVAAVVVLLITPTFVAGVASSFSERKQALWDRAAGTQVRYRQRG